MLKEQRKKQRESGLGEMDASGQKYKLPVIKQLSPGDVTYSTVTTVNNTKLHI